MIEQEIISKYISRLNRIYSTLTSQFLIWLHKSYSRVHCDTLPLQVDVFPFQGKQDREGNTHKSHLYMALMVYTETILTLLVQIFVTTSSKIPKNI